MLPNLRTGHHPRHRAAWGSVSFITGIAVASLFAHKDKVWQSSNLFRNRPGKKFLLEYLDVVLSRKCPNCFSVMIWDLIDLQKIVKEVPWYDRE